MVGDWGEDGQERMGALLEAVLDHRLFSLLTLTEAERQPELRQAGDTIFFRYAWRADVVLGQARALLELDSNALLTPTTG